MQIKSVPHREHSELLIKATKQSVKSAMQYADLLEPFLSLNHAISRYTRECNFLYALNSSMAFPATIFTEIKNLVAHY